MRLKILRNPWFDNTSVSKSMRLRIPRNRPYPYFENILYLILTYRVLGFNPN